MGIEADIDQLRTLGWTWTRIAAHYRTTEREVRRWRLNPPDRARALARPVALEWSTYYVISDLQYPYHDRDLWQTALQIMADTDPDGLIYNGDIIDFPQLSRFVKNDHLVNLAREDVEGFHAEIREPAVAAARPRDERFVKGNHEDRDRRYIESTAPALAGMVSSRAFLQLPDHVQLYEYGAGEGPMLGGCLVNHGWKALKHSGASAKGSYEDAGVPVLMGHTHRVGMYARRGIHPITGEPATFTSWEMGHMSDEAEVPKATAGLQNWHQVGGALLKVRRDGAAFAVDLLPVINNRFVLVNGTHEYQIERSRRML